MAAAPVLGVLIEWGKLQARYDSIPLRGAMPFREEDQGSGLSVGVAASDTRTAEVHAIEPQLERVLASAHFCQSKRCQAFLRYVVKACLDGGIERVKERCIGFEVFHREADYDTTRDSIVRTTAAEVRKRLAQYYLEPEHGNQIQIILPHGSYCPEFRAPAGLAAAATLLPRAVASPPPRAPERWRQLRRWIALTGAVAAVAAAAGLYLHKGPTDFDLFWTPLVQERSEAVICIEQPLHIFRFAGPRRNELNEKMLGDRVSPPASREVLAHSPLTLGELDPTGPDYFTYGDLMAASRLSELLAKKVKPFQILSDRNAEYRDLRTRPTILLGEFNNQWTLRLMTSTPFYLEKNAASHEYEVRDRQKHGAILASSPMDNRREEYAIISRIFDPATETTVVAVVGATYYGTLVGGDFLTRPRYMEDAFRSAPRDWWRKNIQVVISASVVGGMPGPPRVRATRFW
jgi:hypothetical protein